MISSCRVLRRDGNESTRVRVLLNKLEKSERDLNTSIENERFLSEKISNLKSVYDTKEYVLMERVDNLEKYKEDLVKETHKLKELVKQKDSVNNKEGMSYDDMVSIGNSNTDIRSNDNEEVFIYKSNNRPSRSHFQTRSRVFRSSNKEVNPFLRRRKESERGKDRFIEARERSTDNYQNVNNYKDRNNIFNSVSDVNDVNVRLFRGKRNERRDYANYDADVPLPPSSVVTLRSEDEDVSWTSVLREARAKLDVQALGIGPVEIRLNGGVLFKLNGEGCKDRVNSLIENLKKVLDKYIVVSCPVRFANLKLFGMSSDTDENDIIKVIKEITDAKEEEIKVGSFRETRSELYVSWIRLPFEAARIAAEIGACKIGWSIIDIKLMKPPKARCCKCWHFGYILKNCIEDIDRSNTCMKCGEMGHRMDTCVREGCCIICKEKDCDDNHRIGSLECERNEERIRERGYYVRRRNNL